MTATVRLCAPGTAAKLAAEDFGNEILGKKIEIISADHQNKPDIASATARKWFDNEGVTMITECAGSHTALPVVRSVISQRKKVFFVEFSGSTRLTNEECTPYTVQYMGDSDAICAGAPKVKGSVAA